MIPGSAPQVFSPYRGHLQFIDSPRSIGKVGIPDSIPLKPGRFNHEEYGVIKRHSSLGGDSLKVLEAEIDVQSFLRLGKEITFCHREKWDGTGCPQGLTGRQIPLSARIVTPADVYDALTPNRVYKGA